MTAALLPPLIALENVSKRYGAAQPVLVGVNLQITRGEFVVVTGPGGAGKSTLLRLIAGLEAPDHGSVQVAGSMPARLSGRQRTLLRRSIGIIPQHRLLLEEQSVLANAMLPALAAGATRTDADRRARAALARVGIDAFRLRPRQLSASAQQRVMLARAIVNRPALLLGDEPLAHLDSAQSADVLALLEDFAAAGVAVVLASQSESVPVAARKLRINDGKLA